MKPASRAELQRAAGLRAREHFRKGYSPSSSDRQGPYPNAVILDDQYRARLQVGSELLEYGHEYGRGR